MIPQQVAVLGATGSIGVQTLQVLALHPERFQVFGLSAWRNMEALLPLCIQYRPQVVVVGSLDAEKVLRSGLEKAQAPIPEIAVGAAAIDALASHADVDTVVAGIVGTAGLSSVWAACRAGKRLLIANKEPLVMAGHALITLAQKQGARLLPVDSEHNALWQCACGQVESGVWPRSVVRMGITASGGALREVPRKEWGSVTPVMATSHPNWKMGAKITVDSSSMMNKGLELIEAACLFGVPGQSWRDHISLCLHPSSRLHGWVEYVDGSVLAQMGLPDMRIPIAYALGFPDRIRSGVSSELVMGKAAFEWSFSPLSTEDYPALRYAAEALEAGGAAPLVLNAANEVAVQAFLAQRLRFDAMASVWAQALDDWAHVSLPDNLQDLLALDHEVRAKIHIP